VDKALCVDWQCPCCSAADEESSRPALEVDVRPTRLGDGLDADVSLAYELCRPLPDCNSDGSKTLRDLLAMDSAEVDAFSNQKCLECARQVVEEPSYLLSLPEVGATLRERLYNVTALEARDLVNTWRGMSCRNASLIEFSPILTRLLNCNSAPLLLGAGQSAKGAGLYMCKYMVKEAYALSASLSILLDARQNIEAYPTLADDAGAARRTVQHCDG